MDDHLGVSTVLLSLFLKPISEKSQWLNYFGLNKKLKKDISTNRKEADSNQLQFISTQTYIHSLSFHAMHLF